MTNGGQDVEVRNKAAEAPLELFDLIRVESILRASGNPLLDDLLSWAEEEALLLVSRLDEQGIGTQLAGAAVAGRDWTLGVEPIGVDQWRARYTLAVTRIDETAEARPEFGEESEPKLSAVGAGLLVLATLVAIALGFTFGIAVQARRIIVDGGEDATRLAETVRQTVTVGGVVLLAVVAFLFFSRRT